MTTSSRNPQTGPARAPEVLRTYRETFRRGSREAEFEVIASASGAFDSAGPMTREHREYIARRGATYWVIEDCDGDVHFTRVRHSADERAGVAAAVRKSTAFVLGRDGLPVALWLDEDEDYEVCDCSWDPDYDDEVPPEQTQLWDTTITDASGLLLFGLGASITLPASGPCFVVAATKRDAQQLARVGVWSTPVTVSIEGTSRSALLLGPIHEVIAVRLGAGIGDGRVWELTSDAVRLLDCQRAEYVATALRDYG